MPAPVTDLEEYRGHRIDAELASDRAAAIALDVDWRVALIVHKDPGIAHLHAIAELCWTLEEAEDPREAARYFGRAALDEIALRTR